MSHAGLSATVERSRLSNKRRATQQTGEPMTARQRHHLRTLAHQRARRDGRTVMSGIVNVMVAPSPRLTSRSMAADRRATQRIWDVLDRIHPQAMGDGVRFYYGASRLLYAGEP